MQNRVWRLIETGTGSAAWNMAVDEAVLLHCKDAARPVLRLYGWETALSLGRFSKPEFSMKQIRIDSEVIPCVRRISGGGVLVHGGDLSYTLVLPRQLIDGRSVKGNYRHLCSFLIDLYARLGFKAEFAGDLGLESEGSDICLLGNESSDIMIEGKKIGGNAQRYTRECLFQHGSIPLYSDVSSFEKVFGNDFGLRTAATLESLGLCTGFDELSVSLKESFMRVFGVRMNKEGLSEAEQRTARELYQNKYTQARWNINAQSTHA